MVIVKGIKAEQTLVQERLPSEEELERRKIKIRKLLSEVRKKAIENGWTGEIPTREERDKIAEDFLKRKGFSFD